MRVPWTLVKYNNDHKRVPWCSEGLKNESFFEKLNTALQNLKNNKVLLKDPLRRNEGPWLEMQVKCPMHAIVRTIFIGTAWLAGTATLWRKDAALRPENKQTRDKQITEDILLEFL